MKEIIAIIRPNKINATKRILMENHFPAFTCRPCLGRGKKSADTELVTALLATGSLPQDVIGEHFTEASRLIAKRFFTLVTTDEMADKVVQLIIEVNQTGKPGDGKVFVCPIMESYRVRDGLPTDEIM
ncbi:MAG: P-II family nitrogen regulator [Oscillospiraceae bacterium]